MTITEAKMDDIRRGTIWEHKDGGRYEILFAGMMKYSLTGDWQPSVTYFPEGLAPHGRSTPHYTTSLERWCSRFTLAEPPP